MNATLAVKHAAVNQGEQKHAALSNSLGGCHLVKC